MSSQHKKSNSPAKRSQTSKYLLEKGFNNELVGLNGKDISMDKELLKGLNEKEVEIDHLQTTVISLSQKMEVSTM